jgi:hypothetical protein
LLGPKFAVQKSLVDLVFVVSNHLGEHYDMIVAAKDKSYKAMVDFHNSEKERPT